MSKTSYALLCLYTYRLARIAWILVLNFSRITLLVQEAEIKHLYYEVSFNSFFSLKLLSETSYGNFRRRRHLTEHLNSVVLSFVS